jgi:NAD(P)-dependent dehydrogenase (short-subunit alcohol dehydrogenase family)
MDERIAIVTGGNRGIGFEICRQLARNKFKVLLTSRDPKKGIDACNILRDENLNVHFHPLDVSAEASIEKFAELIKTTYGRADVLVNNAGILIDGALSIDRIDPDIIRNTFETNVLGPLRLIQVVLPLMKKQGYGRIVNMSSELGSLHEMGGGYPAYRISKTSINVITRVFSAELQGSNILINSMSPGWVKTEMGGAGAPRSVEQGADTAIWLSMLPDNGPTGSFFKDRTRIEW